MRDSRKPHHPQLGYAHDKLFSASCNVYTTNLGNSSQSLVSTCGHLKNTPLIHSSLLLAHVPPSVNWGQECLLYSFSRMTDINRNARMDLQQAWINFKLFYNYWLGNSNRLCYSPDKKLNLPSPPHKSWEKAKGTESWCIRETKHAKTRL